MTKLGRLVKAGKIKSMEEIYLHSLPIKEYQIVDFFLPKLKDEVMKVCFIFLYFMFFTVQLSIPSASNFFFYRNPLSFSFFLQFLCIIPILFSLFLSFLSL